MEKDDRSVEDVLSTAKLLQRELQDAGNVPDDPPRFIRAQVEGDLMNYMGDAYRELDDPKLAIAHFRKELTLAEANNFKDMRARALIKLGAAHSARNEHRRAIQAWEQFLPLSTEVEDRLQVHKSIAQSLIELDETNKAVTVGRQLVAEAEHAKLTDWVVEGRVIVGKALA